MAGTDTPFVWGAGGEQLSPGQLSSRRKVAEAMMAQGMDSSPIRSPWQGVDRMAKAIFGALQTRQADQDAASMTQQAMADFMGGRTPLAAGGPSTASASPSGGVPATAPAGAPGAVPAGKDDFIAAVTPLAQDASARTGIDPRIIIAQAALESGWGKSTPGNNLFGIKSHGQPGGNVLPTTEVVDGQPVRTTDSFRAYASPADSARGYADFINANPRYAAVKNAQGMDAQIDALGQSGYATDPAYGAKVGAIARSLPAPAASGAPAAAASPASPGVAAVMQATPGAGAPANPDAARLLRAAANPWLPPAFQAFALSQLKPHEYTYQTTPDGTILRMDPRGTAPVPVYAAATKPVFTKVGTDPATGQDVMGFVDQTGRKVEEYHPANPQAGAPSTVPPVPAGVDPKVWRETFSKNAAQGAVPGTFDDTAKLRGEFTSLPAYKNMAQAAPIYQAMHEAAGRNTKAADLNLVYGLGKIMDPGSVVREGEIQMANNAQGWQEKLNGIIAQINNQGGLTPEGRRSLMQEAFGRLQAYKQQFDQDAERYRGISTRNRINAEDVVPDFGEFKPWEPAAAAPAAAAPPAGAPASPPASAGKIRRYNPATGALE